jgi:anti-sigma regulatory factor (Ser/Thr protein kinase)
MYVRQKLPHGAQAPGAAREVVDGLLDARLPAETLAEVRLVVSELVTNAVRHGAANDGVVEMFVTLGGGIARVEVIDDGAGFEPPQDAPRPEDLGGWGLIVVDRLASRWGVEGGPRTRVWAELPLERFDTSGGATTAPAYARNV